MDVASWTQIHENEKLSCGKQEIKLKNEEVQLIFKLRNRVTETKINFQGKYDFYECDACGKEDESQKNILECTKAKEVEWYSNLCKLGFANVCITEMLCALSTIILVNFGCRSTNLSRERSQ